MFDQYPEPIRPLPLAELTNEQRLNISSWYYITCLFAPLVIFVLPNAAIVLHVAIPWLSIFLAVRFAGDFTLSPDPISSRKPLAFGWFMGAVNLLSPLRSVFLGDSSSVPWIACILAGTLFVAAVITEKFVSRNSTVLVVILLASLPYGYSAARELDVMLDHSEAHLFQSRVIHKNFSRTSQSVEIAPWGSLTAPVYARVDGALWDNLSEGGPVCVEQRDGAFGLSWSAVRPCP